MIFDDFDPNDPDQESRFHKFFGPHQIDQQIRQAIQFCWMILPNDKKNADEVEKHIRRLVDRALRDLREDEDEFGLKSSE